MDKVDETIEEFNETIKKMSEESDKIVIKRRYDI